MFCHEVTLCCISPQNRRSNLSPTLPNSHLCLLPHAGMMVICWPESQLILPHLNLLFSKKVNLQKLQCLLFGTQWPCLHQCFFLESLRTYKAGLTPSVSGMLGAQLQMELPNQWLFQLHPHCQRLNRSCAAALTSASQPVNNLKKNPKREKKKQKTRNNKNKHPHQIPLTKKVCPFLWKASISEHLCSLVLHHFPHTVTSL